MDSARLKELLAEPTSRASSAQVFPHHFCCPAAQYCVIHCSFPVAFRNFSKIPPCRAKQHDRMPFTLHFQ